MRTIGSVSFCTLLFGFEISQSIHANLKHLQVIDGEPAFVSQAMVTATSPPVKRGHGRLGGVPGL
jgi:hypothetical protein